MFLDKKSISMIKRLLARNLSENFNYLLSVEDETKYEMGVYDHYGVNARFGYNGDAIKVIDKSDGAILFYVDVVDIDVKGKKDWSFLYGYSLSGNNYVSGVVVTVVRGLTGNIQRVLVNDIMRLISGGESLEDAINEVMGTIHTRESIKDAIERANDFITKESRNTKYMDEFVIRPHRGIINDTAKKYKLGEIIPLLEISTNFKMWTFCMRGNIPYKVELSRRSDSAKTLLSCLNNHPRWRRDFMGMVTYGILRTVKGVVYRYNGVRECE